MKEKTYKFQLPPLPYAYNALEPYIDTQTMELHHGRHFKTFVDNLNALLEKHPEYQSWTLEKLLLNYNWLPEEIRTPVKNNAGGLYNHDFYFAGMTGERNTSLSDELEKAISEAFGSYEDFKAAFKKQALGTFGSGYAWLVVDKDGALKIISSPNQDSPISLKMYPLMTIDVWEHAYYLKHFNKRADYVDDWFNVVDLKRASMLYANR